MKPLSITYLVLITLFSIFLVSCSSNDDGLEEMEENPATSLEENTVNSTTATGSLLYFTIVDIGNYFQITVSENSPNLQNPNFGIKVDLMVKNLPTQTTTFNHRVAPDFNLETAEYFLNSVDFKTEKWHVPFINARPTTMLEVTVVNDIATFTIQEIELSDNFVAPITKTDKINISFSIALSELNANPNTFRELAK